MRSRTTKSVSRAIWRIVSVRRRRVRLSSIDPGSRGLGSGLFRWYRSSDSGLRRAIPLAWVPREESHRFHGKGATYRDRAGVWEAKLEHDEGRSGQGVRAAE